MSTFVTPHCIKKGCWELATKQRHSFPFLYQSPPCSFSEIQGKLNHRVQPLQLLTLISRKYLEALKFTLQKWSVWIWMHRSTNEEMISTTLTESSQEKWGRRQLRSLPTIALLTELTGLTRVLYLCSVPKMQIKRIRWTYHVYLIKYQNSFLYLDS